MGSVLIKQTKRLERSAHPASARAPKLEIRVGELGKGKSETFRVRFGQFRYFRPSDLLELHVQERTSTATLKTISTHTHSTCTEGCNSIEPTLNSWDVSELVPSQWVHGRQNCQGDGASALLLIGHLTDNDPIDVHITDSDRRVMGIWNSSGNTMEEMTPVLWSWPILTL